MRGCEGLDRKGRGGGVICTGYELLTTCVVANRIESLAFCGDGMHLSVCLTPACPPCLPACLPASLEPERLSQVKSKWLIQKNNKCADSLF